MAHRRGRHSHKEGGKDECSRITRERKAEREREREKETKEEGVR